MGVMKIIYTAVLWREESGLSGLERNLENQGIEQEIEKMACALCKTEENDINPYPANVENIVSS